MSLPWLLATPGSRGIGAAVAAHLLATTRAPVVATARTDLAGTRSRILAAAAEHPQGVSEDEASSRLSVLELDVLDESSISAAAAACSKRFPPSTHHLRLAMVVPGVLYPEKSPAAIDADNALHALRVNLLGPMLLAKHFVPLLPKRAASLEGGEGLPEYGALALMSARVGSVSDNRAGGWYSYRCSKAGVTQLARTLDLHLAARSGDNALAVALHPGTVKTGLSKAFWDSEGPKANGGRGLFEPATAAAQLVDVVRSVGLHGRGRFWDWRGKEIIP